MTETLIPTKDALKLLIPTANIQIILPAAIAKRDELVQRAEAVERVAGEKSQEMAYSILEEINAMLKSVESDRKTVTGPFVTVKKRIDAAADELTKTLDSQKARLKGLIGAFQAEIRRKADEEERKRNEELAKLQAERQAAEAKKDDVGMLNADLKAAEVIVAPTIAVPKAEGMKVATRWVTVVEDPAKLYATFPELLTLVPKMMDINRAVAKMAALDENNVALPGCKITKTTDVR